MKFLIMHLYFSEISFPFDTGSHDTQWQPQHLHIPLYTRCVTAFWKTKDQLQELLYISNQ